MTGLPGQSLAQAPAAAQPEGNNRAHLRTRWEQISDQMNANTVILVTGQPSLTYMSFGYDLTTVLDDGDNLRVLTVVGKGGWQNVKDVRFLRGVDLGLAQTNVLGYYRRTGEIGNIDDKITYIVKLYNEEIHFVAKNDITSLEQLRGKKVNFNTAGSGTQLSAKDIFDRLGIKVEELNMGQNDGFEKLKSGEIAATVLSSGKPSPALTPFKPADGYRILPIPYTPDFRADYLPSRLTNADYPGLIPPDQYVDTVAVGTVLICYNWPRNTDRYRRIEKFTNALFTKFPEFQKAPRHPKWKDTNIYAVLAGWKRFPAAEEWLKNNRDETLAAKRSQFDEFLAARKLSPAQAKSLADNDLNRLFEQFVVWSAGRDVR